MPVRHGRDIVWSDWPARRSGALQRSTAAPRVHCKLCFATGQAWHCKAVRDRLTLLQPCRLPQTGHSTSSSIAVPDALAAAAPVAGESGRRGRPSCCASVPCAELLVAGPAGPCGVHARVRERRRTAAPSSCSSAFAHHAASGPSRSMAVALDLVGEADARQAEFVGGAALVPAVARERCARRAASRGSRPVSFKVWPPAAKPLAVCARARRGAAADRRRQVLHGDELAVLGQRDHAADLVLEFAHIAGKVICASASRIASGA